MSESSDYEPAPAWKGHDFGGARKAYARHVDTSLSEATRKGFNNKDKIEPRISTNAQRPLIVVIDETGSMGDWPATMFSKLPYLEHEAKDYLGKDVEISFIAFGDSTTTERYPLQVRPFAKSKDLARRLEELVIVKGGGANEGESPGLAALYLLHNLDVDPLAEPIIIFITDERFLPTISTRDASEFCGMASQKSFRTKEVLQELAEKFSVYLVQKPYHDSDVRGNTLDGESLRVRQQWNEVLDLDHIALLAQPERVVDTIFGILAEEADRRDDFKTEIEGRQTPEQVEVVYDSLATIHAGGSRGKLSKPLGS